MHEGVCVCECVCVCIHDTMSILCDMTHLLILRDMSHLRDMPRDIV